MSDRRNPWFYYILSATDNATLTPNPNPTIDSWIQGIAEISGGKYLLTGIVDSGLNTYTSPFSSSFVLSNSTDRHLRIDEYSNRHQVHCLPAHYTERYIDSNEHTISVHIHITEQGATLNDPSFIVIKYRYKVSKSPDIWEETIIKSDNCTNHNILRVDYSTCINILLANANPALSKIATIINSIDKEANNLEGEILASDNQLSSCCENILNLQKRKSDYSHTLRKYIEEFTILRKKYKELIKRKNNLLQKQYPDRRLAIVNNIAVTLKTFLQNVTDTPDSIHKMPIEEKEGSIPLPSLPITKPTTHTKHITRVKKLYCQLKEQKESLPACHLVTDKAELMLSIEQTIQELYLLQFNNLHEEEISIVEKLLKETPTLQEQLLDIVAAGDFSLFQELFPKSQSLINSVFILQVLNFLVDMSCINITLPKRITINTENVPNIIKICDLLYEKSDAYRMTIRFLTSMLRIDIAANSNHASVASSFLTRLIINKEFDIFNMLLSHGIDIDDHCGGIIYGRKFTLLAMAIILSDDIRFIKKIVYHGHKFDVNWIGTISLDLLNVEIKSTKKSTTAIEVERARTKKEIIDLLLTIHPLIQERIKTKTSISDLSLLELCIMQKKYKFIPYIMPYTNLCELFCSLSMLIDRDISYKFVLFSAIPGVSIVPIESLEQLDKKYRDFNLNAQIVQKLRDISNAKHDESQGIISPRCLHVLLYTPSQSAISASETMDAIGQILIGINMQQQSLNFIDFNKKLQDIVSFLDKKIAAFHGAHLPESMQYSRAQLLVMAFADNIEKHKNKLTQIFLSLAEKQLAMLSPTTDPSSTNLYILSALFTSIHGIYLLKIATIAYQEKKLPNEMLLQFLSTSNKRFTSALKTIKERGNFSDDQLLTFHSAINYKTNYLLLYLKKTLKDIDISIQDEQMPKEQESTTRSKLEHTMS